MQAIDDHYQDEKRDLIFLNNTALELLELPSESNIYQYIADKLFHLIENSHIVVTSYNKSQELIKIESIAGIPGILEKSLKIIGRHPVGITISKYRNYDALRSGKFRELFSSVYELINKKLPKKICTEIEKLLDIKKTYAIGLTRKKELFGSVLVLCSEDCKPNTDLIETFINQASITIQKRFAEKTIIENEEKFRQAFINTPDSANIFRIKDEVIIDVNDAYTKLTGYKRDEIIGKTTKEINLWVDINERNKFYNRLKEKKFVKNLEVQLNSSSGEINTGLINANIYTVDYVEYALIITRDITKRKQAENDLKIQKQYFEDLFHYSPDAIVILDHDENILQINKNFSSLFGYKPEEAIGKPINKLIVPDYLLNEGNKSNVDVSSGNNIELDTIRKSKDGKLINVSVRGKPIMLGNNQLAVYGIYHDITKNKIAERKLILSEERHRIVANQTGQIVYDYNVRTGNISWLGSIEEVLGYSFEEFQLVNIDKWKELVHPEDINDAVKALNNAKAQLSCYNYEYRFKKKNGSYIYIEENGVFLSDEKGEAYRMLGSMKNISDRKNHEIQIELARQKAEESDRLKTAFLANMSHEIRTPMNAIIGFSSLLEDPNLDMEDMKEYIKLINKSGKNLTNVIDDIIDISMIETGQLTIFNKEFSVNEIMEYVYRSFIEIRKIENKNHIDFELVEMLPVNNDIIISDPERIKQVLCNLVGNAHKYTEKGFIRFGCRIADTLNGNKNIHFYVEDSGIGIPAEKKEIVFERFRQVDDSNTRRIGGSGLGLAISKQIANLLNGDITVTTKYGKGSTFKLIIPFNKPKVSNNNNLKDSSMKLSGLKGSLILVAEDVESNYMLLESILSPTGANLLHATDGAHAIEMVKENPDIDLILMDIRMPIMNGYDATIEIMKIDNSIPIIALTAYAMQKDIEKSKELGFKEHLSKPLKPSILIETIKKYI